MGKVYKTAKEALDGILFDGMSIASVGFGLCGIAENSIEVEFNNIEGYIKALDIAINDWTGSSYKKRLNGYIKAGSLKLDVERDLFIEYLKNWF